MSRNRRHKNGKRKSSKLPFIVAALVVVLAIAAAGVAGLKFINRGETKTASREGEKQQETTTESERPDKIDVPITEVKMKAEKRTLRVGDSVQLSASITPKDATYQHIIWSSNNDDYVEISEDGKLTAKAAGENHKVKITAKTDDGSDVSVTKTFRILPKIDPTQPMVAITYDDGPNSQITPQILDALEDNYVVATFFMLGENISGNEKLLKRSKNLGNELANHSYDHTQLTTLSAKKIKKQIDDTDELIEDAIGQEATLMRPPYGSYNQTVRDNVGKPMILWSIDTLDWEHKDEEKVYDYCMTAQDGDIILMHDIQQCSGNAADKIYKALKEKGFQMVTVSELYEYREQKLKDGGSYFKMPYSELEAQKTATDTVDTTDDKE